jgi:hypothetical protein
MEDRACPGCRLPRIFRWIIKWDINGTIILRLNPLIRVALVESDLLDEVFNRIEKAVGIPIRHIAFEAERAAAEATIDTFVPAFAPWLIRNRFTMHPASRFLQLLARVAGMADAHTLYYRAFHGSLAQVRNPFNRDYFAAMTVGAFESMEGVSHEHVWADMGGEFFLFIHPVKEKPEISHRMAPHIIKALPGNRSLNLCQSCGFPKELRYLQWDIPQAMITDTRTGMRMTFVEGYAFSAVFRELVAELGDDIIPVIVNASYEYSQRNMQQTGFLESGTSREELYDSFLNEIAVYGHGNPMKIESHHRSITVAIDNPYSIYFLAGQLLAIYEEVEGHPGDVHWEKSHEQSVVITIDPQRPEEE